MVDAGGVDSVFSNIFEEVPDLFIIHNLEGKIIYVNSFVSKLLDYTPREVLQKSIKDFISPRFLTNYFHYLRKIDKENYIRKVLCLLTKKKQERFLEFNVVVYRQNDKNTEIRGVARDITERKWAEKALADVLGRFESIIEYTPLVAIQSFDANGCIYHWNPVSERLYGKSKREVLEKPFHELFLESLEAKQFKEDLKRVFEEKSPVEARECSIVTADGEKRWVYFSMFPVLEEGYCLEAIRMEIDITERKKVAERLEYLSIHDALTGLYNRGYFAEELHRLDTPRFCPVSIIVCDVDNLKPVNDFLGHDQGDLLLQATARVMSQPFRSSDVVARIGGDEFAVILPHTPFDIAQQACERIKECVRSYNEDNPQLPLSISLGTSTFTTTGHSLMDVFREADRVMYLDKIKKLTYSQDSIPRSSLAALSAIFAKGFPLFINEQARKMALVFGEKVGLKPEELNFLSIPPHLFSSYHAQWGKNASSKNLQQNETSRFYHVLSIVNAYHTMISNHTYRCALSHEEAIAELQHSAGIQLDPELVARFIELFG